MLVGLPRQCDGELVFRSRQGPDLVGVIVRALPDLHDVAIG